MGGITTNAVDPRTAPYPIRPTATAALRPTDPTKERLEVGDEQAAGSNAAGVDQNAASFTLDSDETSAFSVTQTDERSARGGRGLIGALTNFLAKIFTQSDQSSDTSASTRLAGVGAYTQSNNQQSAALTGSLGAEVQSPGFPKLASGRILDLSV